MIDAETIRCWRINYGLDTRTPAEAMRWWDTQVGHAPAGAVAALGICLDEIERLRAAVTALVPIVEKERARLAINQQKAPERMASSYDGLIAPLDAALRLAGINMRSKE